jgi:hypothetical protein
VGGGVIGDRGRRIDVLLVQYNIFWQVVKIAYIGQVLPYYIWQESVQYFGQGSFPPRLLITSLLAPRSTYVHIHPCWPKTKRVE